MAKRTRSSRRHSAQQQVALASPYIQRKLPFFDVLTEDEMVRIDQQVDWMIENIGVAFRMTPSPWKYGAAQALPLVAHMAI